MQKRTLLVLLAPLLLIPGVIFGMYYMDFETTIAEHEKRIIILENQLDKKSLEYKWLMEVTNTLLGEDDPILPMATFDT